MSASLTVYLAKIVGTSDAVAAIENAEGSHFRLTFETGGMTVAEVCTKASRLLRKAAARFDRLKLERQPLKVAVQDRINAERAV